MTATIADPAAALIGEAGRWIGTRETEGSENRGVAVDFFNFQALLGVEGHWREYPQGVRGAPWCASFVSTIGRFALGAAWPVASEVSVSRMVAWAERRGVFWEAPDPQQTPMAGDLFALFYERLARWGHVGIVTGIHGNEISTIEGNTGEHGSREGYGVFARRRAVGKGIGFIHWQQTI